MNIHPLSPQRWHDMETLFGANGACGGCWCLYWFVPGGKGTPESPSWDALKGEGNRALQRARVANGETLGLLAYEGNAPVGWALFGPRTTFTRLERSPSLRVDDADRVWSVPCLFVKRGFRGRGIAKALLEAVVDEVGARGGTVVEGYPVLVKPEAPRQAAAFVFTGTVSLFEKAGFSRVDDKASGKCRMRRLTARTLTPHDTPSPSHPS